MIMNFLTLMALLSALAPTLAAPPIHYAGAGVVTCETSPGSPSLASVRKLITEVSKRNGTDCSHNELTGPAKCEDVGHVDEAGISICGSTLLFNCYAAVLAMQALVDWEECRKTYNGVERIGGKIVLDWPAQFNVFKWKNSATSSAASTASQSLAPLVTDTAQA